jgi:hypothetical protein
MMVNFKHGAKIILANSTPSSTTILNSASKIIPSKRCQNPQQRARLSAYQRSMLPLQSSNTRRSRSLRMPACRRAMPRVTTRDLSGYRDSSTACQVERAEALNGSLQLAVLKPQARTTRSKIILASPTLSAMTANNRGDDLLMSSRASRTGGLAFSVFVRSRIGLSSSSSSTTYAAVVPSEKVKIGPSSLSRKVVRIEIESALRATLDSIGKQVRKEFVKECSVESRESESNPYGKNPFTAPLVESNGVKRCSVCAQQFDATSTPSISVAFKSRTFKGLSRYQASTLANL